MKMKEHLLVGPFALFEEDGEEAIFFETINEILEDRYDVLWGQRYIGYDSKGTRFVITLRVEPRKFFLDVERLYIDQIDEGNYSQEARDRIAASLDGMIKTWSRSTGSVVPPEYFPDSIAAATLEELVRLGTKREQISAR